MSETLSVAIAGAGLSGLCLAQSLLRAGIDVQVYERDPSPVARRQGYRITLDQHGMRALRRCLPFHLFELFLATAGTPGGSFRFTNQDLGEIFTLTFNGDSSATNGHVPGRQCDRLTLRTILLAGLQGRVHFDKAAARVESTPEGARLFFTDGSSTSAALVVGADGVHSALRKQLLPDCTPDDTGYVGIYGRSLLVQDGRTLVPEPLAKSGVLAMGAPGRAFFFTTMAFQESPATAFARLAPGQQAPACEDYVMWALMMPRRELPHAVHDLDTGTLHDRARAAARDFHPALQRFVEHAEIEDTILVALQTARRPARWPVSRATLLGDAVHVMPPFGAHGGNTALRDAALLSEKLQAARARCEPLEQAIAAYQEEMLAYAFRQVDASRAMMRRFTTRNAVLRWAMLRGLPWLRSLTRKSLARDFD